MRKHTLITRYRGVRIFLEFNVYNYWLRAFDRGKINIFDKSSNAQSIRGNYFPFAYFRQYEHFTNMPYFVIFNLRIVCKIKERNSRRFFNKPNVNVFNRESLPNFIALHFILNYSFVREHLLRTSLQKWFNKEHNCFEFLI